MMNHEMISNINRAEKGIVSKQKKVYLQRAVNLRIMQPYWRGLLLLLQSRLFNNLATVLDLTDEKYSLHYLREET
jgi:hypothetical protein